MPECFIQSLEWGAVGLIIGILIGLLINLLPQGFDNV